MKTLTINLPETFQVPGMVDAPEHLRAIPTTQWNEEFCLAAIKHGVKQLFALAALAKPDNA